MNRLVRDFLLRAERNDLKIIDTYFDRAMTGRNGQRTALSDCAKPVL